MFATRADDATVLEDYGPVKLSGYTERAGHDQHDAMFMAAIKPGSISLTETLEQLNNKIKSETTAGINPGEYNNATTLSAFQLTSDGQFEGRWAGDSPFEFSVMHPTTGEVVIVDIGYKDEDGSNFDRISNWVNPESGVIKNYASISVDIKSKLEELGKAWGVDPNDIPFSAAVFSDGVPKGIDYDTLPSSRLDPAKTQIFGTHFKDIYQTEYAKALGDKTMDAPASYWGSLASFQHEDMAQRAQRVGASLYKPGSSGSPDNVTCVATNYMTLNALKRSGNDYVGMVCDGVGTAIQEYIIDPSGQQIDAPRGPEMSEYVVHTVESILNKYSVAPTMQPIDGHTASSNEQKAAQEAARTAVRNDPAYQPALEAYQKFAQEIKDEVERTSEAKKAAEEAYNQNKTPENKEAYVKANETWGQALQKNNKYVLNTPGKNEKFDEFVKDFFEKQKTPAPAPPVKPSGSAVPVSGVPVITSGGPAVILKDLDCEVGEFDDLNELFQNVAANAVNVCAHDNNIKTPQKPFYHMDFDGTVANEDEARKIIEDLMVEIGITNAEQSFWLNKKDDGTFEAIVHTHDVHNLEDLGTRELAKAKAFCTAHHLKEPVEISPEHQKQYLHALSNASITQRYGLEANLIEKSRNMYGLTYDENDLQSVQHSASKTVFEYQSDASPYGQEKQTVTYTDENLTASRVTDNTVKALVLGASATLSSAQQKPGYNGEWDTFNIADVEGVDLAMIGIAFVAANLKLNAATTAKLDEALADQAIAQKLQEIAKKDPYLQSNIDKFMAAHQTKQSTPQPGTTTQAVP